MKALKAKPIARNEGLTPPLLTGEQHKKGTAEDWVTTRGTIWAVG